MATVDPIAFEKNNVTNVKVDLLCFAFQPLILPSSPHFQLVITLLLLHLSTISEETYTLFRHFFGDLPFALEAFRPTI
jgi:hypothetical protein